MMMNSHQHVELVEVKTQVDMAGTIENVEFKCVTAEAETLARELLVRAGKDANDFHMVGILVACLNGPLAGRIVWAKEADVITITKIS